MHLGTVYFFRFVLNTSQFTKNCYGIGFFQKQLAVEEIGQFSVRSVDKTGKFSEIARHSTTTTGHIAGQDFIEENDSVNVNSRNFLSPVQNGLTCHVSCRRKINIVNI